MGLSATVHRSERPPPTPSGPSFRHFGFFSGPSGRSQVTDGPSGTRVWPPQHLKDRGWDPRTEERPPYCFSVLQKVPFPCPLVRKCPSNSVRTLLSSFRLLLRFQGTILSHGRTVGDAGCTPQEPQEERVGPIHREEDPMGFHRPSEGPLPLSVGPEVPLQPRLGPSFAAPVSPSDQGGGLQTWKGHQGYELHPPSTSGTEGWSHV